MWAFVGIVYKKYIIKGARLNVLIQWTITVLNLITVTGNEKRAIGTALNSCTTLLSFVSTTKQTLLLSSQLEFNKTFVHFGCHVNHQQLTQ